MKKKAKITIDLDVDYPYVLSRHVKRFSKEFERQLINCVSNAEYNSLVPVFEYRGDEERSTANIHTEIVIDGKTVINDTAVEDNGVDSE